MKNICISVFLSFVFLQSCIAQNKTEGVVAKHAMIVTAHAEATKVGLAILQKGGNAVDAAVAVQFALAVVYPNAGNIGGGGFMNLRLQNGETYFLDFREKAPGNASRDMFLKDDGTVDRTAIENSQLASGVPGTVDGMWQAHEKFGKLSWEELLQPAVELAQHGFPLAIKQAHDLNATMKELDELNGENENYFSGNKEWKPGDTLIQTDLAQTLKQIQKHGREGFYAGSVADYLVAEMASHNGIISKEDLKNYHAVWRKPVTFHYKNYTVITSPLPSSGGILLQQLLKTTEKFPVSKTGFNTTQTVHLMAEAEKFAYADRAQWLGDADFFDVPVDSLVNENYLQNRFGNFSPDRVIPSEKIHAGVFALHECEETTHFSIVDAEGNAVALTTTLNDSYGSRIFVTGAGFLLNNEMDDFSAKPGEANLYGLIGGEANAIEPGKRMLSSMTPTIVLKGGKLFMVVGSPGGSTIITSVFQNILNVTEHGMTMQESVNAKRFHHQWLPDEIVFETGAFDEHTKQELVQMGYKLKERSAIGRVDAILIRKDGSLEGAADPRGDDEAMGF